MNIKDDIIVLAKSSVISLMTASCAYIIKRLPILLVATFLIRYFLKHMSRDDQFLTMLMPIYTTIILS